MRTSLVLSAAIAILLAATPTATVWGRGCHCGGGGGGPTGPVTPLSEYEKLALDIAINEEYKARATYLKVIDTFGPISPFPKIADSEQRHIDALADLHAKYGLQIPQDTWTGHVTQEFTSKQQACEVGAEAEIANAAVYDAMIPQVSHEDIISTFTKLRDASLYCHYPTFQRWADIYASEGA